MRSAVAGYGRHAQWMESIECGSHGDSVGVECDKTERNIIEVQGTAQLPATPCGHRCKLAMAQAPARRLVVRHRAKLSRLG